MKEKDINSLDHTSWRCQYHIVFAPQISQTGNISRNKSRHRKNSKETMRAKGSRDYRGRVVPRPCAYANKYTTKV